MRLLNFKAFESYLKSSRYLLYHTTRGSYSFLNILAQDMLKAGNNVRGPKGVCFTRNSMWTNDSQIHYRFVFDTEKMVRAGYRPYPLVELFYDKGSDLRNTKSRTLTKSKTTSYIPGWKGDLNWYQQGKRQAPHNISSLTKDRVMEIEFEERVLKDLDKMSRFLIYIDIANLDDLKHPIVQNYLKAHPHVEVRQILNPKNPSATKLIKDPIINKQPIKTEVLN